MMDVPSFSFFSFAAVAAIVSSILPGRRWRRIVLVIANLAFLGSVCGFHFGLLWPFVAILVLGYAGMQLVARDRRKLTVLIAVGIVVFAYCAAKRYPFVPSNLLPPVGYVTVGISYVIFRIVHLIIDSSNGALKGRIGPLAFLSYTLNFTAIVSGPIQLYNDYNRTEWEQPASRNLGDLGAAFFRIVLGCFKVIVISPILLAVETQTYSGALGGANVLSRLIFAAIAVGSFAPYVYINFSGYTDIVIGVARFLGLELPENFSAPFAARGFVEFWSRWHITLSEWLKRYIYVPLLLRFMRRDSRDERAPLYGIAASFLTFSLIGVWHGRTSEFLFYGILQGVGLGANNLFRLLMIARLGQKAYKKYCDLELFRSASRALTFSWFSFSLLWFFLSWSQIGELERALTSIGSVAAVLILFLASTLVFRARFFDALSHRLVEGFKNCAINSAPLTASAVCGILFVLTVSAAFLADTSGPHLVYKAF